MWRKVVSPVRPGKDVFCEVSPIRCDGIPVTFVKKVVRKGVRHSGKSPAESVLETLVAYRKVLEALKPVNEKVFCGVCEIRAPVCGCRECGGKQYCSACDREVHGVDSDHEREYVSEEYEKRGMMTNTKPSTADSSEEEEILGNNEGKEADQLTPRTSPPVTPVDCASLPMLPPAYEDYNNVGSFERTEVISLEHVLEAMRSTVEKLASPSTPIQKQDPPEPDPPLAMKQLRLELFSNPKPTPPSRHHPTPSSRPGTSPLDIEGEKYHMMGRHISPSNPALCTCTYDSSPLPP
eukprot:TRINITY_DN33896_c0_g1_i1.p1 TRINITY_DN33896_c0_g1~~TRINITY_DN33896_c0_g1_i1.p1  ORF type:complete len:293 (+),score=48.33 TRINITY_DN33896_c0_g1_i1:101-979(+)